MAGPVIMPGLADPVADSQSVFRGVLHAMSRPGTIVHLAGLGEAPAPLSPAAAALCLSLVDHDTPLWLDCAVAGGQGAADFLRFHCGSPVVARPEEAVFAVVADAAAMPPLSSFDPGTPEYPDRSATVIIQVAGLADDAGMRLSGPGIEAEARLRVDGAPADLWDWVRDNHGLYPCGVDIVFAAGERIAALPRSTRVEG